MLSTTASRVGDTAETMSTTAICWQAPDGRNLCEMTAIMKGRPPVEEHLPRVKPNCDGRPDIRAREAATADWTSRRVWQQQQGWTPTGVRWPGLAVRLRLRLRCRSEQGSPAAVGSVPAFGSLPGAASIRQHVVGIR